jgi:hypothetical protein
MKIPKALTRIIEGSLTMFLGVLVLAIIAVVVGLLVMGLNYLAGLPPNSRVLWAIGISIGVGCCSLVLMAIYSLGLGVLECYREWRVKHEKD